MTLIEVQQNIELIHKVINEKWSQMLHLPCSYLVLISPISQSFRVFTGYHQFWHKMSTKIWWQSIVVLPDCDHSRVAGSSCSILVQTWPKKLGWFSPRTFILTHGNFPIAEHNKQVKYIGERRKQNADFLIKCWDCLILLLLWSSIIDNNMTTKSLIAGEASVCFRTSITQSWFMEGNSIYYLKVSLVY